MPTDPYTNPLTDAARVAAAARDRERWINALDRAMAAEGVDGQWRARILGRLVHGDPAAPYRGRILTVQARISNTVTHGLPSPREAFATAAAGLIRLLYNDRHAPHITSWSLDWGKVTPYGPDHTLMHVIADLADTDGARP